MNNNTDKIKKVFDALQHKSTIPLMFSAYIFANIYYMFILGDSIFDVETIKEIRPAGFAAVLIICALSLAAVNFIFIKQKNIHHFPRVALMTLSIVFAVMSVINNKANIYFNLVVLGILFYIINYCFGEEGLTLPQDKLSFKSMIAVISVLVAVYTIAVGYYTMLRYKCYAASTFDFGIFAQMFENMAKTGLPITTVERNRVLSHFAVHFSPIYYIFLPGYMIFRTPEYLFYIQALAIASAAFPFAMIAKKFNFTNEQTAILTAAYIFYPTLTGGAFFDFHENKFLTVLILWLFYFILSERRIYIYIFAVLVLAVKEDSFLYVFFAALYMIASRKSLKNFKQTNYLKHGSIIAALSIVYFTVVSTLMKRFGLGVMLYRYDMFLGVSQDGLTDVVINIIKNPSLLLASILTEEKIGFVLYLLVPLCFMPLISKNYKFIIILIPFIIMNLATDYQYQYNVNFQYAYGTAALLLVMSLENLSKINMRHISRLCVIMACFSMVLFMSNNFNKFQRYGTIYGGSRNDFITATETLMTVPQNASVTATTWLVPHLIMRHEEVYMGDLEKLNEYFAHDTDYIINDVRSINYAIYNEVLDMLDEKGYEKIEANSFIEIFKKADTGNINIEDAGN